MTRTRTITLLIACLLCVMPFFLHAQSLDDLKKQVDDNTAQITQLNKEIAQYEEQLKTTTTQKNTLQNKINQLDIQKKKLQKTIEVTQKQISTTQAQISTLSQGIATKQSSIAQDRASLVQSLRRLMEYGSQPLVFSILSTQTFSDAWEDADTQAQLQEAVTANVQKLKGEQQSLTENKAAAEVKKNQLVSQKQTLSQQQGSLVATQMTQAQLLAQTKQQESAYQKIIAEKRAQEAAFEKTLNDLQAKLKNADTTTAPAAGTGVLNWPLDSVFITQYFGDTAFARTAAYKGKGHNGIDLRAAIGTPVHAALDGVVQAINLGTAPNCQYGKWVLVKHNNGLTTLYAHLSSIPVSQGQSVSTGTLIGYSGETGYATGPHLHFTVYVSSGVSLVQYKCSSGKSVSIPISPFNGYLNPMLYLPAI